MAIESWNVLNLLVFLQEFQKMREAVATVAVKSESIAPVVRRAFDRPVMAIMQYIKGRTLDSLSKPAVLSAPLDRPIFSAADRHVAEDYFTERRLGHLGRLMVFDILINNRYTCYSRTQSTNDLKRLMSIVELDCSDRIPNHGIWNVRNVGNPENLMFDDSDVVGIDNRTMTIPAMIDDSPNELYVDYLKRTRAVVDDIAARASKADCFLQLQEFVRHHTGFLLHEDHLLHVYEGWQAAVASVHQRLLQEDGLTPLYDKVKCTVTTDWENVWQDMVGSIDVDFIRQVAGILVAHAKV